MFLGHSYATRASNAAGLIAASTRPKAPAISRRKCSASSGMSSRRFASGSSRTSGPSNRSNRFVRQDALGVQRPHRPLAAQDESARERIGPRRAQPVQLLPLGGVQEDPPELRLGVDQLKLVQEHVPVCHEPQQARVVRDRPSESPFDPAEPLAFDQVLVLGGHGAPAVGTGRQVPEHLRGEKGLAHARRPHHAGVPRPLRKLWRQQAQLADVRAGADQQRPLTARAARSTLRCERGRGHGQESGCEPSNKRREGMLVWLSQEPSRKPLHAEHGTHSTGAPKW